MSPVMRMPDDVYRRSGPHATFKQLGVKIALDGVEQANYFEWLDGVKASIGERVRGAEIVEKESARSAPPLNRAVYYDTADYDILPSGCLLRTSCNRITHAFCACKLAADRCGVRTDFRYVFSGHEKRTIQDDPTSPEAVAIVRRLLSRTDIEHPGTALSRHLGIHTGNLSPAVSLDDLRYTFFVWLDEADALRCSLDCYEVRNLREAEPRSSESLAEVELSIYPRISPQTARDDRVVELINVLASDLCDGMGSATLTSKIKYQRAGEALNLC